MKRYAIAIGTSVLGTLLALWCATTTSLADGTTAGATELMATVAQYGVTWTFAEPAPVGRYVTGDFYVVGPVTVTAITPAPAPGRHGSAINPPASGRQPYDDRVAGVPSRTFGAELRANPPFELQPGQSLVSTISVAQPGSQFRTPDTVPGQYCRGPILTAAVLTCVAEPPPADTFRPAYVGNWKETFRASDLRRDLLPRLPHNGPFPNLAGHERWLQRIWLDHFPGWQNRSMHPWENMPDYGREIATVTSTVGLMLLLDDPEGQLERLLLRYVQLGIDYYGVTQSNANLWHADGGHNAGRKLPIVFAGRLLGHDGMMNVRATFQEDQQTYFGEGYRDQKALWRIATNRPHEHLPPARWAGPPFQGANDGWKSEAYRELISGTFVGAALTARILGLKEAWGYDAFFDYADRWVAEAGDGKVARDTLKPRGYGPFRGPLTGSLWNAHRKSADEIGARIASAAARPPVGYPEAPPRVIEER